MSVGLLEEIVSQSGHVFWPDDLLLTENPINSELLVRHRQVAYAYLLGLAIHHGVKLIMLDRGITALLTSGNAHRNAVEFVPVGTA